MGVGLREFMNLSFFSSYENKISNERILRRLRADDDACRYPRIVDRPHSLEQ